jgi:fructuronate reductase
LPHRTQQIAMDGSQKLQRLLGTVRDNLAAGRLIELALAVAGWMQHARAAATKAGRVVVSESRYGEFARRRRARGDPPALARDS